MTDPIAEFVTAHEISEVLHFTTNHGLLGIFARGALLCRDDLQTDDLLESVRLLNCVQRKDPDWTGYVNLSISAVNRDFLGSSRGWHPPRDGLWWTVLSFSPRILEDPGVVFATTNNTYHAVVCRGEGPGGLAALYGPEIPYGYYKSIARRHSAVPINRPTHEQAEVLYPGRVPLADLQAVYVPEEDHIDDVRGFMTSINGVPNVPVAARPEVFL
ncbi:DarT ssDNA thymidine ADP-ribosyltransferase family protein [Rathayibacter sp. AY1A7]|uniref:DarT ssDNA thymidine ADP-ribosyltransferase family protein n=1 Tax=Rathayibacter sp. AY1A7 TaxID=2080524 RepID=UPI000CE7F2AD|nr:DarT ssDNA thymidine ADP-ribosyltransferase family protein [Rathayibacter sp. AY1A7]PPF20858.1 DUF4433 domain-containing protein [Rathayibacter sp. AY1A7]